MYEVVSCPTHSRHGFPSSANLTRTLSSLAAFDITMLTGLSGKERSESMWKLLISQVGGLEIRNFWQAPELKGEGIVEVGRISK